MTTTKPHYARPTGLTAVIVDDTAAEVVFTTSPYANFFVLQVDDVETFKSPRKIYLELNVNGATVDELEPGTRYWMRVAVCNYEGVRLSDWSAVKSFRTATGR